MSPPDLRGLRIGYAPNAPSLGAPGDRRRFVHYARTRGLTFEIADPDQGYDLVVLSQKADISLWSRWSKGLLVYDLIDSYLAIPRSNLKGRLRGLAKFVSGEHRRLQLDHWKAIEAMCRRADAVICATLEQKAAIRPFNRNVHIILDAHAEVAAAPKADYAAHAPFRLVWEGLPQNLDSFAPLAPILREVDRRRPIELHLVTDETLYRYLGRYGRRATRKVAGALFDRVAIHPWRGSDWAGVVSACDLAIIPLDTDDPFIAGKPENKLLLFWRLGMPALVSATPAYRRAMALAGLPMACASLDDWASGLDRYIGDETARSHAGARGLACAQAHYAEADVLAGWDALFASLLAPARTAAA